MNRLHPAIPMAARARPGQTIVFRARNASDFDLDPESTYEDPRAGDSQIGTVHPLTGPVHIEGAEPGDVLAVTLLDIAPGRFGYTSVSPIGFVSDHVTGSFRAEWRLNRIEAVSDDLPGVRIPNASFPGIVTVLPGPDQLAAMLSREAELRAVGGAGFPPYPTHASPAAVCGPEGSHPDECLRTLPPREHGGNLDIRYLQVGVTLYLPCYVAGCGLAIGDPHFAQGDGEVSGTAIEMDADFTLTTRLIKEGPELRRGPHFEGPVRVLDIPSRRFYATTGFPAEGGGRGASRHALPGRLRAHRRPPQPVEGRVPGRPQRPAGDDRLHDGDLRPDAGAGLRRRQRRGGPAHRPARRRAQRGGDGAAAAGYLHVPQTVIGRPSRRTFRRKIFSSQDLSGRRSNTTR